MNAINTNQKILDAVDAGFDAHELLSREDLKAMLDKVRETSPAVVDDLVPSVLSSGVLHRVLCMLLEERVPVSNLTRILESLAAHAGTVKDPSGALVAHAQCTLTNLIAGGGKSAAQTCTANLDGSTNCTGLSTGRIDAGTTEVEGWQGGVSEFDILDWGKIPYIAGEMFHRTESPMCGSPTIFSPACSLIMQTRSGAHTTVGSPAP